MPPGGHASVLLPFSKNMFFEGYRKEKRSGAYHTVPPHKIMHLWRPDYHPACFLGIFSGRGCSSENILPMRKCPRLWAGNLLLLAYNPLKQTQKQYPRTKEKHSYEETPPAGWPPILFPLSKCTLLINISRLGGIPGPILNQHQANTKPLRTQCLNQFNISANQKSYLPCLYFLNDSGRGL